MPESTSTSGRILSRYRILEEVGRGGMATVFRALDPSLGREVAVKVLHPHLAGDPEARARLEREAQAVAKLRHDNILEIFDYSGADSSDSFIVTEFIRGPTLTDFLAQHEVGIPDVAVMIAHELAAALQVAHSAGIIHRDIKPENIMIRADDGRIKLTDFGIAQVIDKERLTATGQLIGSPAYLAPELVEGGRIDFRTDVFSLGIVLYRVATGELPFSGRNPHEMMKRIVEGRYPPPDQVNPAVGRGLARILGRALARRPDDRYPDMEAMRSDLAAELGAAGISEVRAELRAYFADPEGWERTARPRLVGALVGSGRTELTRGHGAAALALVTRALALSPSDAAAEALFDRIGRRRRRGRLAVALAVLALATGATAGTLRYLGHRPGVQVAGGVDPGGGASASPIGLRSQPDVGPVATPPGLHSRTVPLAPIRTRSQAAPQFHEVKINVAPKNVEILVDNLSIGPWSPGQPLRLAAGSHRVTFRNPACWDTTIVVAPTQTALPLVRLRWKDAYVDVITTPESARVVVDPDNGDAHEWMSPLSAPIPVPIPLSSDDGRERVLIEVSQKGFRTASRSMVLTAGEHIPAHFDLQPIPLMALGPIRNGVV